MLSSMSFVIFCVCHKHNSLPLGLIQPSSPSTKELHGQTVSTWSWLASEVSIQFTARPIGIVRCLKFYYINQATAITQWIFDPKHNIYAYQIYIVEIDSIFVVVLRQRGKDWPIFKNNTRQVGKVSLPSVHLYHERLCGNSRVYGKLQMLKNDTIFENRQQQLRIKTIFGRIWLETISPLNLFSAQKGFFIIFNFWCLW